MNKRKNIFSPLGGSTVKKESNTLDFENPWLMVREWYSTDLGQALLSKERESLSVILEQIFGFNLVQLGCLEDDENNRGNGRFTADSRTSYQYSIESLSSAAQAFHCTHLVSSFEQLPLQTHSVDAVVLPHTLEFEQNPHQILREVDRILVAEGKAVFLGFNPFSPWGLWHKYWEVKKRISSNTRDKNGIMCKVPLPSCGHLISQKRLSDWLKLLGFDIKLVSEYFYRPPVRNSGLLNKLEFMEQAGQFSKLLPAGGYLMVATKRVSTLTPIRQGWKFSNNLLSPETAGIKSDIHSNIKPK